MNKEIFIRPWLFIVILLTAAGLGATIKAGIDGDFMSSVPVVRDEGRINTGGNAIANFGVVPINPDWLVLTHKSGQPIESTPAHEWALLTSAYEPHLEKIPGVHEYDRPTWRITFP